MGLSGWQKGIAIAGKAKFAGLLVVSVAGAYLGTQMINHSDSNWALGVAGAPILILSVALGVSLLLARLVSQGEQDK